MKKLLNKGIRLTKKLGYLERFKIYNLFTYESKNGKYYKIQATADPMYRYEAYVTVYRYNDGERYRNRYADAFLSGIIKR